MAVGVRRVYESVERSGLGGVPGIDDEPPNALAVLGHLDDGSALDRAHVEIDRVRRELPAKVAFTVKPCPTVGFAGEIHVETTVGGTDTALPGRMMLKTSWAAETM